MGLRPPLFKSGALPLGEPSILNFLFTTEQNVESGIRSQINFSSEKFFATPPRGIARQNCSRYNALSFSSHSPHKQLCGFSPNDVHEVDGIRREWDSNPRDPFKGVTG